VSQERVDLFQVALELLGILLLTNGSNLAGKGKKKSERDCKQARHQLVFFSFFPDLRINRHDGAEVRGKHDVSSVSIVTPDGNRETVTGKIHSEK